MDADKTCEMIIELSALADECIEQKTTNQDMNMDVKDKDVILKNT